PVRREATPLQSIAPDGRPAGGLSVVRDCAIFRNNFKLICAVQSRPKKYSASPSPQITSRNPAIPSLRGALAIVTNVGTGCGGRGSVGRDCNRRAGLP